MKKYYLFLFILLLIFGMAGESSALLISGPDIIAAPYSVEDDPPGATNEHQQAFDEAQNVLLTSDLEVDGGIIASGVEVDSHMIFFNTLGSGYALDSNIIWTFDGDILGVMSDIDGTYESLSNSFLGAPGTIYPGEFGGRGMEGGADHYLVTGSSIEVSMAVTEPGDWIRVVTRGAISPVPEPTTMLLLGSGLVGLAVFRRKFKK